MRCQVAAFAVVATRACCPGKPTGFGPRRPGGRGDDFGHTKAWLLAGALWLFSEMTWATLRTLPAPIVIVIIVIVN